MTIWLPQIFEHPLPQRVGWALLHSTWQGAAAALALAVVLRWLRNGPPHARWLASCMALAAFGILPLVTACVVDVERGARIAGDLAAPLPVAGPGTDATTGEVAALLNAASYHDTQEARPAAPPAGQDTIARDNPLASPPAVDLSAGLPEVRAAFKTALPWIVLAWLIGVAAMSLWHLGGWLLLEWTKRRLTRTPAAEVVDLFDRLRDRLRFSRPVKLLETAAVRVPMVVGAIRPAILLPLGILGGLTPSQLEAVLAHELAHIRRHDYLIGLLQAAVETLMFYHPAVWWISGRIRQECEVCCDEWTLAACPDRRDYATALARAAEWAGEKRGFAVAATGGKLAHRIRRILGLPRADVRPNRWPAFLLLLAAILIASFAFYDKGDQAMATQAAAGDYDHFFYMRHNEKNGTAETDSLMMVKATADGFAERSVFARSNMHVAWQPLVVAGGKFYGISIQQLLCIDLASGKAESLDNYLEVPTLAQGKLYAQVRDAVRVYDFATQAYRDIGKIEPRRTWNFGNTPLAVSPDGKRIAFFTRKWPEVPVIPGPGFKLGMLDVETGKTETIGPEIHSLSFSTGGGGVDDGPPLTWLDAKTILVVCDGPGRSAMVYPKFVEFGPEAPTTVCTLDVVSGQLTEIVALPRWERQLGEPYFAGKDAAGTPRVNLGQLGQYRIDLQNKRLLEDDMRGGDYRYRSGRAPERIMHGDATLAEAPRFDVVSVSPSGAAAVWHDRRQMRPENSVLSYHHSAGGKVREVARGWLPRPWSWREAHREFIVWAKSEDLAPAPERVPDGWQAFKRSPYPEPPRPPERDLRPIAGDLIDYVLSTDKPAYKEHEQVQLTVALVNKTRRPVSFKPPRNTWSLFGVGMDSPYSKGTISEFERLDEIFPEETVTIEAGKSFRVTKAIETHGMGKYEVSAELDVRNLSWQGRLKAKPIEFTVAASDDGPALFKVKYDRLMARCRAEFQKDPATCDRARLWPMGPKVVPLLIADLAASQDPKFRQTMSRALVGFRSPESLPYFEKLLQGELKDDREMVLEGLAELIRGKTAVDRALPLLISATKHAAVDVRRGAVKRLVKFRDAKVKEAMEAVLDDSDVDVSLPAARYLAAMENLDLIAWLTAAIDQPTQARYLAAKAIVRDLERTWNITKGKLPDVPWAKADAAALDLYRQTLRNWLEWGRENLREAGHFFDEDRKVAATAVAPAANPGVGTMTTGSRPGLSAADFSDVLRRGPIPGTPLRRQIPAELTGPDGKFDAVRELLLNSYHLSDPVSPLEQLLQDAPKGDRDKVLEALAEKVRRKDDADRALSLLISGTTHSSAEVRLGAAARLVMFRDPKIKNAMADTLGGADSLVAKLAARYVAAYDNLDLIDWLAAAMSQPTRSRYFAARVIVADLERTANETKGKLPDIEWPRTVTFGSSRGTATATTDGGRHDFFLIEGTRTQLSEPEPEVGWPNADAATLNLYRQTLRNWLAWALQHPHESARYFDGDRKSWNAK